MPADSTVAGAIASAGVIGTALIAGWVTRRNAKEPSAIAGFAQLATELRTELTEVKTELRGQAKEVKALQEQEKRKDGLARVHVEWDREMVRIVNDLTDEEVPAPPPLD